MKPLITIFLLSLAWMLHAQNEYYFPSIDPDAPWETTDPAELNWCPDQIDSLYDFLGENGTKGFLILKSGKIVIEKYYDTFTQDSFWYWASAAKCLTATLVGIAQEDGLLSIDDRTSDHLGVGWTVMDTSDENKIQIIDQLTMTTGIDDRTVDVDCLDPECLDYLVDPGERWSYHNAPYRLLLDVLESASGTARNLYTFQQLGSKIGMGGLWLGYVRWGKPRDLARFGHLILSGGVWDGNVVLGDTAYINAMTQPSQNINPSYGYLWWLNGQETFMYPRLQVSFEGPLIPSAPADMFSALGRDDQKIHVVPSLDMVVVRMGRNADDIPFLTNTSFDTKMWEWINALECNTTGVGETPKHQDLICYPNPVQDKLVISSRDQSVIPAFQIVNVLGQVQLSFSQQGDAHDVRVTVEDWNPGLYHVVFEDGRTLKFVR